MKKFLALLFVCAGLTAMAGMPQISKPNFSKATNGQMVMKANTFSSEMSAPAMKYGKDAMTPRKLMKDLNMRLSDNMASNKAPRRLSDNDLENLPYIDFRYCYTITENGIEEDPWYYRGGQGVYMKIFEDSAYPLWCAGIYWNQNTQSTYYLPLIIDYNTGLVELPPIGVLDDDTITGKNIGSTRVDTVDFSYLLDANYVLGDAEEPSSIYGNIYSDGTIEFNDTLPYVFAGYRALLTYSRSGNPFTGYTYTLTKTDTTFFTEIYSGTQFIVANGNHNFGYKGQNATETKIDANVYMYQYDDTTVVVFNPWGFGYPGRTMNIFSDGTMKFPGQYVYNDEDGDYFANGNFELDANDGFIFDADGYVDGFIGYGNEGNVTPDAITWHSTVLMTEEGSLFYPFLNNVLTFTDGSQFVLGGDEILIGDANRDGIIDISDVTALINALLTESLDDTDDFSPDAADFDQNGGIDISDVTALINYLLTSE
jgi:hypothetical protein